MPFLEILTRHLITRPGLLAANQASLENMGGDWIQTVIEDFAGRGVGWANQNLGRFAPQLIGGYIWILDDDDLCTYPNLGYEIGLQVQTHNPDVIIYKMDHGPRGILPDPAHWEKPPEHGFIGVSAYVVKRELWQKCADAWTTDYYADFLFAQRLFEETDNILWRDLIVSRVQHIGLGRPERELVAC